MSARKLSDEQEQEAAELYVGGMSTSALGIRYGVSGVTIGNALRRQGCELRNHSEARRSARRTPQEVELAVVAGYAEGYSTRHLSKQHHVSYPTVYAILERHGVPRRENAGRFNKTISSAQEDQIVTLYAAGSGIAAVCRELRLSRSIVRATLQDRGIELRPQYRHRREFAEHEVAKIIGYWEAGESQATIGRRMKMSQTTVSQILRNNGHHTEHRQLRRENHGNWNGGRNITSQGYVAVIVEHDDPLAAMRMWNGYALEHRLVMARSLGRPLTRSETVHHINGVRDDNRLENLQLHRSKHAPGQSFTCADCGSHNIVASELAAA